jgi:hypothetical protein
MNAVEIESAVSDLAALLFDAAEFPFAFLAAFGNKETTLKRLRTGNNNASDVPGGVLLRNCSCRTISLRKRLNQLGQTSTIHR